MIATLHIISVMESFSTIKRTVIIGTLYESHKYTESVLTGYARTCYIYLNLDDLRHLGHVVNILKKITTRVLFGRQDAKSSPRLGRTAPRNLRIVFLDL